MVSIPLQSWHKWGTPSFEILQKLRRGNSCVFKCNAWTQRMGLLTIRWKHCCQGNQIRIVFSAECAVCLACSNIQNVRGFSTWHIWINLFRYGPGHGEGFPIGPPGGGYGGGYDGGGPMYPISPPRGRYGGGGMVYAYIPECVDKYICFPH